MSHANRHAPAMSPGHTSPATPGAPYEKRLPLLLLTLCALSPLATASASTNDSPAAKHPPVLIESTGEGRALVSVWENEGGRFTPKVEAAFLEYSKAKTLAALRTQGKELPADFLAWIDGDPLLRLDIYGTRKHPAETLLWLRALEIDGGAENVRSKYTQLALALATVAVQKGAKADITPRAPLKLAIGGDPRVRINTKDTSRPADPDDDIINFLEDHAPIDGEMVGGLAEALPELVYDKSGVATSLGEKKKDGPAVVKRQLIAADVLASAALQKEFNEYMAAKGRAVRIDCGDHVIFPGQTAMIAGKHAAGILDAYTLFRKAYEAKGRIPIRDAPATFAERFLYIIRNDAPGTLPDTYLAKNQKKPLPKFPLTAPWPMLTYLAEDDQPLREREDMLNRLKTRGEFHTYGEYIGPIAQQTEYQRARRLAPFEFGYKIEGQSNVGRDPLQMMIKDGGVCGTMAAMQVCSYNIVNIPSCTAGQPAHCALIHAKCDPATGRFSFSGAQYATGGDEVTHPHAPWYPGDFNGQRPMAWHLALAEALNFDTGKFFESLAAMRLHDELPPEKSRGSGATLLVEASALNPFDILAVTRAISSAKSAEEALSLFDKIRDAVVAAGKTAGKRPGAPDTAVAYLKTVGETLADRLVQLPHPTDAETARRVDELIGARHNAVATSDAKARKIQSDFNKTLTPTPR